MPKLPALPKGLVSLSAQARDTLRQAVAWVERQTLRVKHAETLERFHNKEYGNKDDTIDVALAFNKGLLDSKALLSPLLATQIDRLTDTNVLFAWNRETLDAMNTNGGKPPPGAVPLNSLLRQAVYQGNTDLLQWLVKLDKPWEKLAWSAELLLLQDLKTAHWAMMWHQDLLATDEPHRMVHASLTPQHFISLSWMNHLDKPNTTYSARQSMDEVSHHAHNVMWLYFRDMPWQERWATFVDLNVPCSPVAPTTYTHGIQGLMQGRIFIAGLLYNAPLDIQKCLAAFKNSRHPKEDINTSCDVEPKAIRHAFFGGPAPKGPVPGPLQAWLSVMQGTPKEQAGSAWVEWYTNSQAMTADMDVALPDSLFDLQGSP